MRRLPCGASLLRLFLRGVEVGALLGDDGADAAEVCPPLVVGAGRRTGPPRDADVGMLVTLVLLYMTNKPGAGS